MNQNPNMNPNENGQQPSVNASCRNYIGSVAHSLVRQSKPKPTYCGIDCLLAWFSVALGILLARAMPVVQHSLGGILTLLMLFALGIFYLKRSKIPLRTASILYAVVAVLLSVGLITGANKVLQRLLFTFILFAFFYWSTVATAQNDRQALKDFRLGTLLYALFSLPFSAMVYLFSALIHFGEKAERNKKILHTVGWFFIGLLAAVTPTAIVLLLLCYDEQFKILLDKIFSFSFDNVWSWIGDIIFGILIAHPLFGSLFGAKCEREGQLKPKGKIDEINCHILPKAMLCTAVTPILIVYIIFFISQWDYYLSAFTKVLPANLTYATYARSGFFELCWICGINAFLLLLFNLLIRKREGGRDIVRSIYSTVISFFTLILIATALSKMLLYINTYGLTQKRIYASWLMLLLATVFVLVIVWQFTKRLPIFLAIAVSFVVLFGAIAIPDVDGMIASYNVDHYLSGDLAEVDVESIGNYGVSAVPALVELRDELASRETLTDYEKEILQKADNELRSIRALDLNSTDDGFFSFNIPRERAKRLLGES